MKGDADVNLFRLVARCLVFAMLVVLFVLMIDIGRPVARRISEIVASASIDDSHGGLKLECRADMFADTARNTGSSTVQSQISRTGAASAPMVGQPDVPQKFTCRLPELSVSRAQSPPVSVDSSINAVAIVIAVVTLILTVGTSWFAQRQAEFKAYSDEIARTRELGEALIAARVDLIGGLGGKFGPAFAARDGQILASMLEMLQSSQSERRQRAYISLKPYFGPDLRGDFPDLYFYVRLCERNVPTHQESWCDVFA